MASLSGAAIRERAGTLDLSRELQGPAMKLPAALRGKTGRLVLHISTTLGRDRTAFWSPRRTVLTALLLLGEDAEIHQEAERASTYACGAAL